MYAAVRKRHPMKKSHKARLYVRKKSALIVGLNTFKNNPSGHLQLLNPIPDPHRNPRRDPAMKHFLLHLAENLVLGKNFVHTDLDDYHLFIDPDILGKLQEHVDQLMESLSFPMACATAMPPEGSTMAGIPPDCRSLDRVSREAEVGFEPETFWSRHRAHGPDDLPPALVKNEGEVPSQRLSDLFACIWEKESVPDKWGESVLVPVFKTGARNECGNHRGISLTPVVTRLLASIVLRRLTVARETLTREQQAGF
ncbi:hypothetical protein T265_07453 [Opisthorchis viverrini]|uniref:Reverse transcriptase domain-containing protein n=1 Tax=Opisthorchis viverrini TaxID=6198 RepID=A0A074ZCI3_OPIVI|nr:hypothetical protein T265_07453 [Opisthorchis viverrini]KER25001.1 hypothetical protein T265_07453 [Opisthorchis viverrini]